MPYDPGPQRKVKAAAMVAELDRARRTHTPELGWPSVAATLASYSTGEWRQLSVASGRPDRVPSAETRAEVLRTVQGLAEAAVTTEPIDWARLSGGV